MKALIFGGTVFVGKSLAEHLVKEGHEVSIFTSGKNASGVTGLKHHYQGDRRSCKDLEQLQDQEFDCVFDISAKQLEDLYPVLKMLAGKRLQRYVFCSSGAVYLPSEEVLYEDSPRGYHPLPGAYGLGQLEVENKLLDCGNRHGLPVTIFRPAYIYGKYNNLYREAFLFDRISKNQVIPIPKGDTRVSFIHIDDLVKLLESCVDEASAAGQAFHAAGPEPVSWREWVMAAAKAMDQPATIKEIGEEDGFMDREYFPFRNRPYVLSGEKLGQSRLYQPVIDLETGMKLAYEWYQKMPPMEMDVKMCRVAEACSQ